MFELDQSKEKIVSCSNHNFVPQSINVVCAFQITYKTTLGRFVKKIADDQYSSVSKGRIYHIKHMSIQPFALGMVWPEIGCLMEVPIMIDICTYCIFMLCGTIAEKSYSCTGIWNIQLLFKMGAPLISPPWLCQSATECQLKTKQKCAWFWRFAPFGHDILANSFLHLKSEMKEQTPINNCVFQISTQLLDSFSNSAVPN